MSDGVFKLLATLGLVVAGAAVLWLFVTIAGFFFDLSLPPLIRM